MYRFKGGTKMNINDELEQAFRQLNRIEGERNAEP